jgi:hypothetical protein
MSTILLSAIAGISLSAKSLDLHGFNSIALKVYEVAGMKAIQFKFERDAGDPGGGRLIKLLNRSMAESHKESKIQSEEDRRGTMEAELDFFSGDGYHSEHL